MTSKERAYLRGLANGIKPIFQIGKGGISENIYRQFDEALEARELIKASVLKNADQNTRSMAEDIAANVGAEVVSVMGNKFVLYRESRENKTIFL